MTDLSFADAGRLSHAYIISAPSRELGLEKARELAAAALCSGDGPVPCGKCRNCRKVRENIHPDVIFLSRPVDDKGREKKEIGVDMIRGVVADACVLPNEAEGKVYIIDQADCMNIPAQNAALKLLEEPPAGVTLLLCVTNPQQLLPTVRSRCVELSFAGSEEKPDGEKLKLAREYLKAAASGSRSKLCSFCFSNEGMDIRSAAEFTEAVYELAADMLCGREKNVGLPAEKLRELCELMERCRGYLDVNTGVKHVFGLLAADSVSGSPEEDKEGQVIDRSSQYKI